MSDIDLDLVGKGLKTGLELAGNKIANDAKRITLAQQKETNKLAFEDMTIRRIDQLNNQLSAINASAARRGVSGGQAGVAKGAAKAQERETTSDLINTLNRERSLLFQEKSVDVLEKTQKIGSAVNILSSAAI